MAPGSSDIAKKREMVVRAQVEEQIGDVDAATHADRDAYRPVVVTLSGLLWWIAEPPANATGVSGDELSIDAGPLDSLRKRPAVPVVSDDAFAWWIFVRQWNAFMYFAATDASLVP